MYIHVYNFRVVEVWRYIAYVTYNICIYKGSFEKLSLIKTFNKYWIIWIATTPSSVEIGNAYPKNSNGILIAIIANILIERAGISTWYNFGTQFFNKGFVAMKAVGALSCLWLGD